MVSTVGRPDDLSHLLEFHDTGQLRNTARRGRWAAGSGLAME